jgi:hypothetical protein
VLAVANRPALIASIIAGCVAAYHPAANSDQVDTEGWVLASPPNLNHAVRYQDWDYIGTYITLEECEDKRASFVEATRQAVNDTIESGSSLSPRAQRLLQGAMSLRCIPASAFYAR